MTSVRRLNKNEVPLSAIINKSTCISLSLGNFVSYNSHFIVSPHSYIVLFSPEEANT